MKKFKTINIKKFLKPDMKKSTKIKVISGSLAIVLVGGYLLFPKTSANAEFVINEADASISSIVKSIDSSGSIEPFEQYDIVSLVSGDILEDTIEVGDLVSEGDLLYHIDSAEIENNMLKAENSLKKSQNSYEDTLNSVSDLNIKSTTSGVVTAVYVKNGDTVSNNTKIADVIDTSALTVSLPFHGTSNISVGDTASVLVEEVGETLTGTVTNVSNGTYIADNGTLVGDVEIKVSNPGVLTNAYTATATINGITSANKGSFEYINQTTITSSVSGTITSVNAIKGDNVSNGTVLAVVYSEEMQNTLENSALTLSDAEISYETSVSALDDYKITSPINGTIMSKTYKAGDTVESSNGKTTLAVVADMSSVKFTMQIDEINITSIEKGTEVLITADAIEGTTYSGYVSSIGLIGTSTQGVTTYPVEVVIDDAEGLLPSMNVSATIITEKAENVVVIPSSYVSRNNGVLISNEDAKNYETTETYEVGKVAAEESTIEGYTYLYVETGISDGSNVEITNGLKEGTTVYMQTIALSDEIPTESSVAIPGMTSGMTGGATGGGMPSGGGGGGGMRP